MANHPEMTELILASGSPYRRELLARLGLPFKVISPDIDERAEQAPDLAALAERLALLKARAVAAEHPGAVIIGSDQVAECQGRRLGKPGTVERAKEQLASCSGREVMFHTAVAVIASGRELVRHVPTRVIMKTLTPEAIGTYVERDQPLDCAGAMKSEALGIALTDAITSDDPTALIGLPLIAVSEMLAEVGLPVLTACPPAGTAQ
jgi:septum formation protein